MLATKLSTMAATTGRWLRCAQHPLAQRGRQQGAASGKAGIRISSVLMSGMGENDECMNDE